MGCEKFSSAPSAQTLKRQFIGGLHMKVAILGAGKIGSTLAAKWSQAGHSVMYGVRDQQSPKLAAVQERVGPLPAATIARAIAFGDAVVWAVPGATVAALAREHATALAGKIMIDASNNVGSAQMSALSVLTAQVPDARIFRAFNTLGWENFADPVIAGVQADLFYCGHDDPRARSLVEGLIYDVGLRPIYIGGLDQAATLDGLTRLWFALALGQKKGRHLAFKLLAP
jgi:8-hydroxy-5-deazaflavin:NADPH oxidoreductase